MTSVTTDSSFGGPRFGHAWTTESGTVCATVRMGLSAIRFTGPADAWALAAVCTEAAHAMEAEAARARDQRPAPEPCGDTAGHTQRPCELPPGHEAWHRAGQAAWPWKDGEPPSRPPAAACPSCGTPLESGRCPACAAGVSQ